LAPPAKDRLKNAGKALLSSIRGRLDSDPVAVGNAPVDPLGEGASSEQLATEFSFLRASALTDVEGELPRYQDLQRERPEAFYSAGEAPPLVLFVSHRWQTPIHPDPSGESVDAVRYFLRAVAAVATAASSPPQVRSNLIPSLRVHGIMQAAVLLGNERGFGAVSGPEWRDFWVSAGQTSNPPDADTSILRGIAVFYDFSCIPQGLNVFRKPSEEKMQQVFMRALRRLHLLINASTVLVLRTAGDDYGTRAWCVAELSIGRPEGRHLVLRTDMLGEPVTDAQLLGESLPSINNMATFRKHLPGIDDQWRGSANGWGVLHSLAMGVNSGLPELEAERSVPLLMTPHAPMIFPGHQRLLEGMWARLADLSDLDQALDGIPLVTDVAELVTYSLEQADLRCTVPEDRVYVGLHMLYARSVGSPRLAQFFGECLRRYVDRRTTRLARYREVRSGLTIRAWWVFADEPEGSAAWRVPKWASE
jgi:hypothetical protein